ncbi:hypothetical protein [Roseibium aggregatum]|uniref:Uncharacterized protein n=1 Tax=Roseibium aggregatum TaxID=187304 RepID=A0A926NZU3_9HYPH|nr:hypothetical protein [Roseibium aggregatum]MBD1546813.1 hypothetical protein [Roseibium aggregatum]
MIFSRLILAAALSVVLPAVSGAAEITSAYTKLDLDACEWRKPTGEEQEGIDGGTADCPGYAGIPVYVSEGDLRMFVSFGADADNEPAAHQTLPNFNTINDTLEWRLRDGRPFATILRWFPDEGSGGKKGNILIVTQIAPGATCQVARIDAQINSNANVLARQAADKLAYGFDCSQEPMTIGRPGRFN